MVGITPVARPKGNTNVAMNSIRFAAAFLVVIFHLRSLFVVDFSETAVGGPITVALYGIMSLGHQAVIVFFVLSGFWVGGSVINGVRERRFSAGAYASARLIRLWIVLIPAIVLTLILDAAGTALHAGSDIYVGSAAYHSLIPLDRVEAHTSALSAVGNMFFLQDIYVPTVGGNSPLWSLAAEFWYYLLFPAVVVAVWKGVSLRARLVAIVVIVLLVAILSVGPLESSSRVLILAPTWAIGAGVAWFREDIEAWPNRRTSPAVFGLRIALGVAVLIATVVDSRIWNAGTTYVLAVVAALWLASLVTDVRSRVARTVLMPFSFAAEWSYSLYAIHLPILALVAATIVPLASDRWQLTAWSALLCLAISLIPVAAAMVFYVLFERNTNSVRKLLRRVASARMGNTKPRMSVGTTS
ncbi:acyltransferase [Cryobacterium sp. TMS1-13-1]|uniref:acyltransferase family protein n=1 Tax=Cryobacterium sp. TMS1-13-1 TaxID=1259220 RepID=UPI00141A84D3|nr:acyltransferase [Cryobacterium sp. TMS1-13-1]